MLRDTFARTVIGIMVTFYVAMIAVAIAAPTSGHVHHERSNRLCFPASEWSGNDARRPCARVAIVYEDGSMTVIGEDADGLERWRTGVGTPVR